MSTNTDPANLITESKFVKACGSIWAFVARWTLAVYCLLGRFFAKTWDATVFTWNWTCWAFVKFVQVIVVGSVLAIVGLAMSHNVPLGCGLLGVITLGHLVTNTKARQWALVNVHDIVAHPASRMLKNIGLPEQGAWVHNKLAPTEWPAWDTAAPYGREPNEESSDESSEEQSSSREDENAAAEAEGNELDESESSSDEDEEYQKHSTITNATEDEVHGEVNVDVEDEPEVAEETEGAIEL